MYGISMVGLRSELITMPLRYRDVKFVQRVVLITDLGSSLLNDKIRKELGYYNIETEVVQVDSVFNFPLVFLSSIRIQKKYGKPEWINVTAGPGIAIAALALSCNETTLIYYKENTTSRGVLAYEVKDMMMQSKNIRRTLEILKSVSKKDGSEFDEICNDIPEMSRATVSRRLQEMIRLNIIDYEGAGKGRSRKKFHLRQEWKKMFPEDDTT